jgi:asparagine synthase (glutamine-hydrolysing)
MCGFAGFVGFAQLRAESVRDVAIRMGAAIAHRGPDDIGVWRDDDAEIALVHRRLSILDLSAAGHQPMLSASGRYVIAFNGEIYNHLELRAALEAGSQSPPAWRGHSDTETLLAGIERWGVEDTLKRSVGMFALAVWDRRERALYLARDRAGEKPLYYGWQRGVLLFGSELKALKPHPAFVGEINRDAIASQMRLSYIPAPHSIYQGVFKLLPGHLLKIDGRRGAPSINQLQTVRSTPYWSFPSVVEHGLRTRSAASEHELISSLEGLLRDAVRQQMVADVPLGAFLSGGVDSSTVVALMQAQSARPVKTFTIGFDEEAYNEAEHAKQVARHLGTDHTELYVTPEQALGVIPRLPAIYDEPFSDPSQIPTFLVAELTRRHVTVSLSGDAGDELFGGYNRYTLAAKLWGKLAPFPPNLRRYLARALTSVSPAAWSRMLGPIQPVLPAPFRAANPGQLLHKGAAVLACRSLDDLYLKLVSHWDDPASIVLQAQEPHTAVHDGANDFAGVDGVERMMALDFVTYLPDDILVKVDRAAMAVSLETRVPFLDHRVVEFASQLPLAMKLRDGQGKWLLRQVLYKYVPKGLIDRPKMGFGVPIDSWLRGPLRDWAEALLDEPRLRRQGFLEPMPIRTKWQEHVSGKRNWQYHLWDVLMFQAWLAQDGAHEMKACEHPRVAELAATP